MQSMSSEGACIESLGNRRTVVMRKLSKEGYKNPKRPDLDFKQFLQVLPEDTSEKVMKVNLFGKPSLGGGNTTLLQQSIGCDINS